jgi:hypothetical protein
LALALGAGPFVETVSRNDTTALLEGLTKGRPLFERLGLGVDALAGAPVVGGKPIDQTPACALHPSTLELGGNDEMLICRCDIEAWPIGRRHIAVIVDPERLGHSPPFLPSHGESPAHSASPLSRSAKE